MCVCMFAQASRISVILWENVTAPETGKVSLQRSRAGVVKLWVKTRHIKKTNSGETRI